MIVASADLSNSGQNRRIFEKDACDGQRRLYRPFPATGRSRVHDGLHHERHGAARRRNSGLRNVLRILGLYETRAAYRRAATPAGQIRLDARLVPRGRGRSDAPTDRTRSTVAPDGTTAQPQRRTFGRRTPSGRQLRNRRRLENRDGKRTSDRADPVASEYQESARSERRPRQGSHAGRQGRLYRRRLRRNPGRNLAGERFGSGYADRRRRKA